jgi:PKD repeat protein
VKRSFGGLSASIFRVRLTTHSVINSKYHNVNKSNFAQVQVTYKIPSLNANVKLLKGKILYVTANDNNNNDNVVSGAVPVGNVS